MTIKAASESSLGELHNKVAKVMTKALDNFEAAQDAFDPSQEGSILPEVNASLLSVITKFLNENKITCAPEENEDMSILEQRLANKLKGGRRNRRQVGNVVHMDPYQE